MSIARWLRVGAAVAAVAAVNVGSPQAAHAAVTPCTDPNGVVAQGHVAGEYFQLRYDRRDVGLGGSGLKVCFQVGGAQALPGHDTYGVIDVPMPGASVAAPQVDGNYERCKEHPYNEPVFVGGHPRANVRIDYYDGPSWDAVCYEVTNEQGTLIYGGRIIVHGYSYSVGVPQADFVSPSPARDTSKTSGWPAGEPSSSCSGPGQTELVNFYSVGNMFRVAYTAVNPLGTTAVCFRRQDAATGEGTGGKASLDTSALPSVTRHSDAGPCSELHAYTDAPRYLRVSSSPLGSTGAQSVCVSDHPANTIRVQVTPSLTGVVNFTPDSDTP